MMLAGVFWASLAVCALCLVQARGATRLGGWDVLFLLCAWEPFNTKLWERYLARWTGRPYDAAALLLIALALAYAARRRVALGWRPRASDAAAYAKHLALLALLLIPLGLSIGFLRVHPRLQPGFVRGEAISYFLFVAPSEELIFRGLLLNLLERRIGGWPAVAISAAFFGASYSHLTGMGVFPNWRYGAFAFVCGLAYGSSYLKSRRIAVPIVLHGSVDFLWRVFLT